MSLGQNMKFSIILLVLISIESQAAEVQKVIEINHDGWVELAVVPSKEDIFVKNNVIYQLVGTGIAAATVGNLKISNGSEVAGEGFYLKNELQDNTLGVGYTAEQVDTYIKELNAIGGSGDFISTVGIYFIDKKIIVDYSDIDLSNYKIVVMQGIGSTSDKAINALRVIDIIENDLTSH